MKSEIEDYLRDLNAFLTDAVSQGSPSDDLWRSIELNLRGVASSLFDQVIPEDLKPIIETWSRGEVLAISTNEQWIPWELLFDGTDFWGKKFIVTRYPRLLDHRTHAPIITAQKSTRPVRRIVNVIGGGIPPCEKENAMKLFEEFIGGVTVDILNEKPLAVLSDSLPKADLLHFTCHGHLDPHMLRLSDSESQVETILPTLGEKEAGVALQLQELFAAINESVTASLEVESQLSIEITGSISLKAQGGTKLLFLNLGTEAAAAGSMKILLSTTLKPKVESKSK